MTQLLFVCTGNICRSPFAERYAAAHLPAHIAVVSAGTGAVVGAPVEPEIARLLRERGGDPSGHRARQLDRSIVDGADLVLAMETAHRRRILDEHPGAVGHTLTLGQAARALADLPDDGDPWDHLRRNRRHADSRDDIADPYRRGDAAMRTAADQISAILDRLLPVLAH